MMRSAQTHCIGWLLCLVGVLGASNLQALVGVVGSLDRHYVASPGELIQGQIEIQNTLDEPLLVRVDVTDYLVDAMGQATYPAGPTHTRSLARYIQLMSPEQTVGPGGSGQIGFEVQLPTLTDRPELAGAYWAVVMVEQSALEKSLENAELDQWVIQERFQTAVRITTEVAGNAKSQIAFDSPTLTLSPEMVFSFDLANQGQRLADVVLLAELFDASGQSLGQTRLGRMKVYPGHQRRLEWAIDSQKISRQQALEEAQHQSTKRHYEAIVIAKPMDRRDPTGPIGQRFLLQWDALSQGPSSKQAKRGE